MCIPLFSLAETVGDLLQGRSFLLKMNHIRLGEYAASSRNGGSPARGGRHDAEPVERQTEPARLLFEEGARSGGAEPVTGEVCYRVVGVRILAEQNPTSRIGPRDR